MALSEFEIKKCEKAVSEFMHVRRPPPHIRNEIDLGYRIQNQSIELFEIRPVWDNPKEKAEYSFAKATYVKTQKIWKIYWLRANLKWYRYEPVPEVKTITDFLNVVDKDEYCCFFG